MQFNKKYSETWSYLIYHQIRTSSLDEYLVGGLGEPGLVLGLHADDVARVLGQSLDCRPRHPRAVPLRGRVARLQGADLPLRLLVEHGHLETRANLSVNANNYEL